MTTLKDLAQMTKADLYDFIVEVEGWEDCRAKPSWKRADLLALAERLYPAYLEGICDTLEQAIGLPEHVQPDIPARSRRRGRLPRRSRPGRWPAGCTTPSASTSLRGGSSCEPVPPPDEGPAWRRGRHRRGAHQGVRPVPHPVWPP